MAEPLIEETQPELYGSAAFVRGLEELRAQMDLPEDARVLYPGSSTHTDVGDYFGKDNVVHLDLDPATIEQLAANGYRALQADIHGYQDKPFDVVVTLNTYTGVLNPQDMRTLIKPNGYLITNMYPYADNSVREGLLRAVTRADTGQDSMGPHFQENSLGLYQYMGAPGAVEHHQS